MEKDTKWFIGIFVAFFIFMCIASANGPKTREYTVQAGESWCSIAQTQKVDLDELLRVNNATMDTMLYPNQVIKIPVNTQQEDNEQEDEKPQWMEQNSQ